MLQFYILLILIEVILFLVRHMWIKSCLTATTATSDYYRSVNAPPLPPVSLHVNQALRRKEL